MSHLYCVARPSWHYNDRSVCVSEHTSLSNFFLQLTWRVLCHSPSLVLALRCTLGQMATMVRLREVVDTWNYRRTVWVALTINTNGQYCGSELALTINTPRSILRVRTWPEVVRNVMWVQNQHFTLAVLTSVLTEQPSPEWPEVCVRSIQTQIKLTDWPQRRQCERNQYFEFWIKDINVVHMPAWG